MDNPSFQVAALGQVFTIDPAQWLEIDRMNLDEALAKQAAGFGFLNRIHEELVCRREEMEGDADDAEAQLAMALQEKGMKPTDRKERIRASTETAHRRKAIAVVKRQERLARAMKDAMKERKDCLIELMRAKRSELSTPTPVELQNFKDRFRR